MSNSIIIIVFVLAIAYLLVTIAKFKVHAFFAMITCSLWVGIVLQMPLPSIVSSITSGFGGILGSLGIVLGLGSLLGALLGASGATGVLANSILDIAGEKRSSLAMNIIGFIISIPVYMGSAYIILDPLNHSLAKKTKKNVVVYITSLCIGLLVTHCLVIPTPGPLAVASTLGLDVGWFILYAIIVSIPASLCGGWLWGEFLGKKYPYNESELKQEAIATEDDSKEKPSAGLSFFLIFLPIIIIFIGTVLNMVSTNESITTFASFLTGNSGVVALLVTDFLAMILLKKYLDMPISKIIPKTFNDCGDMLFILGAGGSFGAIVTASGIGDVLVNLLSSMNISVILLAYVLCILLRAALGSATTALLTTATILGPVASQMGANMVLLGLSICVAAIGLGLPTDGAFWMVAGLDNTDFKKTFNSYTLGSTVASVVGFAVVLLLNAASGFLPGLH
jgi:GntP family gluconate:H+ symporter